MDTGDTLRFPRVELATHSDVMAVGRLMSRELPLCQRHHGEKRETWPVATHRVGEQFVCDDCVVALTLGSRS